MRNVAVFDVNEGKLHLVSSTLGKFGSQMNERMMRTESSTWPTPWSGLGLLQESLQSPRPHLDSPSVPVTDAAGFAWTSPPVICILKHLFLLLQLISHIVAFL